MRIYTLVGKSGTGKSFHAMDLCRKENIESIIDDGLYISEYDACRILGQKSRHQDRSSKDGIVHK